VHLLVCKFKFTVLLLKHHVLLFPLLNT